MPIQKYPNMKWSMKYWKFHKSFGYSIVECFNLREEIKVLIINKYFKGFVLDMRQS